MSSTTGESKISKRLDSAVKAKQFYEVHQIYRTLYFRFKMKKNYSEAIKTLDKGASFLLENDQYESGTDLSNLIVNAMESCTDKLNSDHVKLIVCLFKKMIANSEERSIFMNNALSLFKCNAELRLQFDELLAQKFWAEGSLVEARKRIFAIEDGYMSGLFLIDLHNNFGLVSEIDLFIAQPVLQSLCSKKTKLAVIMFYTYTTEHSGIPKGPPFEGYPLLNFVWLLLLSIQGEQSINVFKILCNKYEREIRRDPCFFYYIDKIGHIFFNMPLPESERNSQGGLIGKLFKLIGGSDDMFGDMMQSDGKGPQSGPSSAPMTMDDLE